MESLREFAKALWYDWVDGSIMDVRFRGNKMERCYREFSYGQRMFGIRLARSYIRVINALRSVDTFELLKQHRPYRFHQLRHQHSGRFAVNQTGNWRLIIEATEQPDEFLVHSVEDYHER